MLTGRSQVYRHVIAISFLSVLWWAGAWGHGGGNWDPFTIDSVNDRARDHVLKVQALMAEVIRGQA